MRLLGLLVLLTLLHAAIAQNNRVGWHRRANESYDTREARQDFFGEIVVGLAVSFVIAYGAWAFEA